MGSFVRPLGAKGRQEKAENREASSANALDDLSKELMALTDPLRRQTVGTLQEVLAGGRPMNMRVFAPEREAVESQFRRVRENILSTTPMRGGQLNRSLADVEMARAGTLGGLEADVRRQAFNQALGTGFGVPPVSIAGLTSAGNIFGTAATRSMNEYIAKNQSVGQIAGIVAGGMCWIAEAIYGRGEESQLARLWIVDLWEGRLADATRWAYGRWGRRVSMWRGVWVLRPLFNQAVRRARRALAEV